MQAPSHLVSRTARIAHADSHSFDLAVIGGGIHGVCLAAMAAKAGLSVVLLERHDYAHATSSRSSKMAHGGLRYLEMYDFQQVFEGIKAREELFDACPNFVSPEHFLIPVQRGDWWFRFKLGVGLHLYDLMVRNPDRKHRWIARNKLGYTSFHSGREDLQGCFRYTDGLMKDARLVFALLTAAERYGVCALNYAHVEQLERVADTQISLTWRDALSTNRHQLSAKLAINCAGPWAPEIQEKGTDRASYGVKFSRGSHLVFSVPWRDPSLFLPLAEKGRYYFVWPHPSGTLVGTTEREVSELELDPLPSPDEVDEILNRLQKDLPASGLTRESLLYGFAGIRTLPLRNSTKGVSQLSRKHVWRLERGVLTLLGGKYTTFAWTASEGLKHALTYLGLQSTKVPDVLREMPSALSLKQSTDLCAELAQRFNYQGAGVSRAVARLGRLVVDYVGRPEAWQEIAPGVLRLEAIHAVEVEHAQTIEDIIRRRLELEPTPSHGIEALEGIKEILSGRVSEHDLKAQERAWRTHIESLMERLQVTGS
jgi:glycerol-3-phosphate dehydrogenase